MKVSDLFEEAKDKYFDRLMNTLNITRLGKGAFGHVFQHPTFKDVAVKIFNVTEDKRFARYIEWCAKNQNNPWVPKILHIEQRNMPNFRGFKDDPHMFVFMEKLSPSTKQAIRAALKLFINPVPINERSERMLEALSASNLRILNRSDWKKIAECAAGDVKVMTSRLAQIGDNNLDIHDKNVMLRGKQLVFTDPVI